MLLTINWRYWQAKKIHTCVWRFKAASYKRASLKSTTLSEKKVGYFSNREIYMNWEVKFQRNTGYVEIRAVSLIWRHVCVVDDFYFMPQSSHPVILSRDLHDCLMFGSLRKLNPTSVLGDHVSIILYLVKTEKISSYVKAWTFLLKTLLHQVAYSSGKVSIAMNKW